MEIARIGNGKRTFIALGLSSIIFLISLAKSEGIKCYQCQDDHLKEEPKPCRGAGMVSECESDFHLCLIIKDSDGQIFRGCHNEGTPVCQKGETHENASSSDQNCVCDHDNCNKEWSNCCPEAKRSNLNLISDHIDKHKDGTGFGGGGGEGRDGDHNKGGDGSAIHSDIYTIFIYVMMILPFAYGPI